MPFTPGVRRGGGGGGEKKGKEEEKNLRKRNLLTCLPLLLSRAEGGFSLPGGVLEKETMKEDWTSSP